MENFQDGQPRPEYTKSSSAQPNHGQNDRTAANQTTQQNASGGVGGANQSTFKDSEGASDQTNRGMSAAAVKQPHQAQNHQPQPPQAQTPQAQGAQAASQSAISQAALGKQLGAKFVVPGESGNRYDLGLQPLRRLALKLRWRSILPKKSSPAFGP